MPNIIEKIKRIKGLRRGRGCTFTELTKAEKALGLAFPDEYREYVKNLAA